MDMKAVNSQWERIFSVAEDAIEGGAADAELAGGAEFIAAIQVQNILHMVLNDGIKVEGVSA